MNSKSITDLSFEKATVSVGYKLSDKNELALQQKFQIQSREVGKVQLGLHHRFCTGFDSKVKVDQSGLLTLLSRQQLTPTIKLNVSVQTSAFCNEKSSGLLNQPVNFGVKITHNN
jgi:hypothetical protein